MKLLPWACLLALLAFWVAARVVPARDLVFPAPGEVRLMEPDSYFHLRHARSTLRSFPRVQRWDPYANYPWGQRGENQGAYDVLLASAGLIVGEAGLPGAAAWAPVLLSAGALLLLYLLGRRLLGPWGGLLPVLLTVLFPGPLVSYASLGFADHHAWEVLLALLTLLGLASSRPWLLGGALLLWVYSWPGSAVYLVVAALALAATAGMRPVHRQALTAAGMVLAGYLLPSLIFPDLSPGDRYQRGIIAGLVMLGVAVPAVSYLVQKRRWSWLAALLLVGLIALAREMPMLHTLLAVRASSIMEHRAVTPGSLVYFFGTAVVLAPLTLLGAWRRPRAEAVAVATAALLLVALWVRTRDFAYLGPPLVALLAAMAAAPWLKRPWQVAAGLALLTLPALATSPMWVRPDHLVALSPLSDAWADATTWMREHTPAPTLDLDAPTRGWGADLAYPAGTYGVLSAWDRGHYVTCLARRPVTISHTESASLAAWLGWTDEEAAVNWLESGSEGPEKIEYVVLGTETAADGFLTAMDLAGRPRGDFRELIQPLVVGGRQYALHTYGAAYRRSMAYRLVLAQGDGLRHFRLIYPSPVEVFVAYWAELKPGSQTLSMTRRTFPLPAAELETYRSLAASEQVYPGQDGWFYDGQVVPALSLYQVVKGARLRGRSAPGTQVQAALALTARGRTWTYTQTALAGADGAFELVLPYPTAPDPGSAVQAAGPYFVAGKLVHVTLEQVLGGATLHLP